MSAWYTNQLKKHILAEGIHNIHGWESNSDSITLCPPLLEDVLVQVQVSLWGNKGSTSLASPLHPQIVIAYEDLKALFDLV